MWATADLQVRQGLHACAVPTHPSQRTECWVQARHNEWAHSSSQVPATPATARQHQCHGQQSGIGDAGRNAAQSDSGGQRNRRLVPYMMGDKHGVDGNSPQRSTRTGLRARKDRDTSSAAASTLPRPSTNHALSPTHHHAGLHISHAKCAHAAGRHVNCSHAHASTHNKRAGTSCIHKLHPQAHNLCHPRWGTHVHTTYVWVLQSTGTCSTLYPSKRNLDFRSAYTAAGVPASGTSNTDGLARSRPAT